MKSFVAALMLALVVVVVQLVRSGNAGERSHPSVTGVDTSFTVVNSGLTAYLVNGVSNASLTIFRRQTCRFNVTAVGHPFFIKTARVTGTGSQFTSGVTNQGVTSGQLVFVVPDNAPDTLFYQCGVHAAMGGTLKIGGPLDVPTGGAPNAVRLGPARPNPAREGASFAYSLPQPARVYFALYDARGRRVRALVDEVSGAGDHTVSWNGRDDRGQLAPSGVYFYRLRADGRSLSGRFVMEH